MNKRLIHYCILDLLLQNIFHKFTFEYLSFPVDSNDSSSRLMGGSDKNGLSADSVHVDTGSSFQVIQVDVAIFGDEKDYILLGTDLDVQKGEGRYNVYR